MNDMITTGERWNSIDSAEMALGIQRVVDSVMRQEELPLEYREFLERGIEFLDEAEAGSALISGTPLEQTDSFKGTFSPLCMATDVYITFKDAPDKSDDYKQVSVLLNGYKTILTGIKDAGTRHEPDQKQLKEIGSFFGVLFDLLSRQADPITKEYSQPFTFVRR